MLTPDQISDTGNRIARLGQTSDQALSDKLIKLLEFLADPGLNEQLKSKAINEASEVISKTISLLRKKTNREVERVLNQSVKQSMADDFEVFEEVINA